METLDVFTGVGLAKGGGNDLLLPLEDRTFYSVRGSNTLL